MENPSLKQRRQALLERSDLTGIDFCRAYSAQADLWLSAIAEAATKGKQKRVTLVAVGGYGRGELCPYSDLDVMLLHTGGRDISGIADSIWYPVWDEGVHLDHSVRRPKEVLQAAGDDLRVALGLLDARVVWGNASVAIPLIQKAKTAWQKRLGATWLDELERQMASRRDEQGDVAFLLEPDLKESHGGLRDAHVLSAIGAYAPILSDYVDFDAMKEAATLLTRARVELHRGAGRERDKLLLQEQDQVGTALGYADADALMVTISKAGRAIAWASDDAWRRRRYWQPDSKKSKKAPALPDDREIEEDIILLRGEVALSPTARVSSDPSISLRLAAVSAETGLPVAQSALHRLCDRAPEPPDPWTHKVLEALVRTLLCGRRAIDALEAIDQTGLLVRVIPEWAAVRNRPQRNSFHRFTVDRHLLEAAVGAAALSTRVSRPDLLVLGALFHDIGKGFEGDHTQVGIELIEVIGNRMGLPSYDVSVLVAMCRWHLLLPDTATRRDLDDPTTIERVAEAVLTKEVLSQLWALTEADSLATGPAAWGTWKQGLVNDLVERVDNYLSSGQTPRSVSFGVQVASSHSTQQAIAGVRDSGQACVILEPPRVILTAPDRPGLLAAMAGTLALYNFNVKSADVTVDDGVAIEVFTVETTRRVWPDATLLASDLNAALLNRLELQEKLAAKARDYAYLKRPSSARPIEPGVSIDLDASAISTVIEVRAPDEIGLLHRVTRTLFECDLDVINARVSTLGDAVVDAFYLRDTNGEKITDEETLRRVGEALLAVLT